MEERKNIPGVPDYTVEMLAEKRSDYCLLIPTSITVVEIRIWISPSAKRSMISFFSFGFILP